MSRTVYRVTLLIVSLCVDLTHPSGLRSPVTSTNGEIVMAKAPSVPKAPKPPVEPVEPAAPVEPVAQVETVEMPNTLLVQHNVTKKQFRVSKRYFETYSSVLTRVD